MKGGNIRMNGAKHVVPDGDVAQRAREAKNSYQRAWNKKNPEKVREYRERYWAKRAAQGEQEHTEGAE